MAVGALIERHGGRVYAWLILGPSIVGSYSVTGLINPFWGSLSGWPLHLATRGHSIFDPHPWYEAVAFFGGPLAMFVIRIWLAGRLLSWRSRWREPVVVVWALSAFAVVPVGSLPHLFPGWPVWCACM